MAEFDVYKKSYDFDTGRGRPLGDLWLQDEVPPYEEMTIHKLGLISLGNDSSVQINHPGIRQSLEDDILYQYDGPNYNYIAGKREYEAMSDEEKSHYKMAGLTPERIQSFLEGVDHFYSLDVDEAHEWALQDDELITIANSLMALSFDHAQREPKAEAFNGVVRPQDFDKYGNLAREFESEEAELAHMFVVNGLVSEGKSPDILFYQQKMREGAEKRIMDLPESEHIKEPDNPLHPLQVTMFGTQAEVGDPLEPEIPALKDVHPLKPYLKNPDSIPPELLRRHSKRVPAIDMGYSLTNIQFAQYAARRATHFAELEPWFIDHENHPEHTRPSIKNYWQVIDYRKA